MARSSKRTTTRSGAFRRTRTTRSDGSSSNSTSVGTSFQRFTTTTQSDGSERQMVTTRLGDGSIIRESRSTAQKTRKTPRARKTPLQKKVQAFWDRVHDLTVIAGFVVVGLLILLVLAGEAFRAIRAWLFGV